MRANIEINEKLLADAQRLSKIKTAKETVNQALEYYVKYLKRQDMRTLGGKVKWEGDLDQMRQI
jgi:Arc/MetJ family transcription regulator